MRQLLIQLPQGRGAEALEIAQRNQGANLACWQGVSAEGASDFLMVHVSNEKVDPLLAELQSLPNLHITLLPQGVIALQPPESEAPEQAKEVSNRSPIEVFLSGLQAIGSWTGFLGYAIAAGFVVWIGLFTNTIFLLVAAMLIAPFAGPAMNVALGSARGDAILLRQSLLRYFLALLTTIVVCYLLSMALQQSVSTTLMVETSEISAVAVLLPLVAGAAGALNLVQSERNSLVSGAAIGVLVAASLSPPAGLIGMAGAIGRWDMAQSALFLLLLQLVGINLAGMITFRVQGLSPQGVRYSRGQNWLSIVSIGVTVVALAGLLFWQFSNAPNLQRATRAQRAVAVVHQVVEENDAADLVEANVRFTRAHIQSQNTLLGVIYVQRKEDAAADAETIRQQLTQSIQQQIIEQGFDVAPLIAVQVLEAPPSPAP